MRAFGSLIGAFFPLLMAAVPGFAAVPETSIEVRFIDRGPYNELPGSKDFGIPTLQFRLKGDFLRPYGERMRKTDLFRTGQSARIGKRIQVRSQDFGEMRIHLGVSEETEFATVAEQIARLKRLAATNASENCKFVILVFTVPGDKPRPKPAEQADVDGPDIDENSI